MLNRIFTAFRMCMDKYTCIPLPECPWDDDLARVSEAFLPAVGLIIGLLWWALAALSGWLLPVWLGAALIAAFPFIITAFAHMQAFLKYGKIVLFGGKGEYSESILLGMLILFQFAASLSIDRIFPLAMIPVLSRACLALRIFAPKQQSEEDGPAVPASLIRIEQYIAAGALILMLLFSGWGGLLCGGAVLGVSLLCGRGMEGKSADAAGFALTASELCGLIILAIL